MGPAGIDSLAGYVADRGSMSALTLAGTSGINGADIMRLGHRLRTHPSLKILTVNGPTVSPEAVAHVKAQLYYLHSPVSKAMVVICSARDIPRLGARAGIQTLPTELLRLIARTLQ